MPRRHRALFPGVPTHLVQRGNNRSPCFFTDNDRQFYLAQLSEFAHQFECAIHAYVLMDNHVHILATPSTHHGISQMMKHLGQNFAQFINRVHRRTGALWEGRFYSSVVDSGAYLFTCYRYVELNPVRAGMVRRPDDYRWSSYRSNADGDSSSIITPHPQYVALSTEGHERRRLYRMLFDNPADEAANEEIRNVTLGGHAFGSDEFKARLAVLSGRPMAPRKRGPKRSVPK